MEIRLGQRLQIKQELTVGQRIELRHGLTQALQQRISEVQREVVGPPQDLLKKVIERLIVVAQPPALQEALRAVSEEPRFLAEVISGASKLMRPTKRAIQETVIQQFYTAHRGEFRIHDETEQDPEGSRQDQSIEPTKFPMETFMRAFFSPGELAAEYELMEGELKKRTGDEGPLRRRREIKGAIEVAHAAQGHIQLLEQALTYFLTAKETPTEARPLLQEFLTEYIVLGNLSFTISDRMQRRFASSFMRARPNEEERLENAFLNTIGEYVLISMGVIDPEIFRLQKMVIDEEEAKRLRQVFAEVGLSYDEICRKYALKGEGKIFWNRWATRGVPIGLDTDEQIRAFITESIRTQRERILVDANYSGLFQEVLEAKEENAGSRKENVASLQDALREIIAETLQEGRLQDTLKELIKNVWYPELQKFFKPGSTKPRDR